MSVDPQAESIQLLQRIHRMIKKTQKPLDPRSSALDHKLSLGLSSRVSGSESSLPLDAPYVKILVRVDSVMTPFCLRVHARLTDDTLLQIIHSHFQRRYLGLHESDAKSENDSDDGGSEGGDQESLTPPEIFLRDQITFRNGYRCYVFSTRPQKASAVGGIGLVDSEGEELEEEGERRLGQRQRLGGAPAGVGVEGDMPVFDETPIPKAQISLPICEEPGPSNLSVVIGAFASMPRQPKEIFLKHGTINRVVMKLTDPFVRPDWVRVFLRRFEMIIKPKVLLMKLIERYNMLSDPLVDGPKRKYSPLEKILFDSHLRRLAHAQVLLLLQTMTRYHLPSFSDEMVSTLRIFARDVIALDYPIPAQELSVALLGSRIVTCPLRQVTLPYSHGERGDFRIEDYSPRDVAEQLTIIDSAYFNAIQDSEFVKGRWNKPHLVDTQAPNVARKTHYFCCVKLWIIYVIVQELNVERRGKIVEFFLDVHAELRELNSFDMMTALNLAITSNAIKRRKNTFKHVSMDRQRRFRKLERETHVTRTSLFTKLLERMALGDEIPVIPFVAMYQSKILRTEDQRAKFKNMMNVCCPKLWCDYTACVTRFIGLPHDDLTPIPELASLLLDFVNGIAMHDRSKVSDDLESRASDLE